MDAWMILLCCESIVLNNNALFKLSFDKMLSCKTSLLILAIVLCVVENLFTM